jgi:hypothetical protein
MAISFTCHHNKTSNKRNHLPSSCDLLVDTTGCLIYPVIFFYLALTRVLGSSDVVHQCLDLSGTHIHTQAREDTDRQIDPSI